MHIIGVLATVSLQFSPSEGCGAGMRVETFPSSPRQGTLFRVRVSGAVRGDLSGAAAGEPLHFSVDSGGTISSFAGAPIDSTSVEVVVSCGAGAVRDTTRLTVPLSAGKYPMERLKVAPRFSAKPDSALEARQRGEAARAAEVSANAHETPRLWSGPFAAPRTSRVTSRFGGGREFNGTVTSRHMGTDFAGATGAPIRAINRGVVRLVDRFYLGGRVVYIDHGAGLVTAYMHMSAQRVAVGDTVSRGTVIGSVGATGRVTGPHLHLIVRYGGVSVDPESLLSKPR